MVARHISGDSTVRFSSNFPDSKIVLRKIFCVSSGEFLCAKFGISLQTQENSSVGQDSLSDSSRVTIRNCVSLYQ